jgi:hypothetical protein
MLIKQSGKNGAPTSAEEMEERMKLMMAWGAELDKTLAGLPGAKTAAAGGK